MGIFFPFFQTKLPGKHVLLPHAYFSFWYFFVDESVLICMHKSLSWWWHVVSSFLPFFISEKAVDWIDGGRLAFAVVFSRTGCPNQVHD